MPLRGRNRYLAGQTIAFAHYAACMEEPGWWTYLKATAGTEDGQELAVAAGVSPPQVSRWKSGKNRPDADKLVRFARYHGKPPIGALIAGGYLTPSEAAEVVEIARNVRDLSDEELLSEVSRRMKGQAHDVDSTQTAGTSGKASKPKEAWLRSDELKERPGEVINSIESPEEPAVDRGHDGKDGHDLRRGEV